MAAPLKPAAATHWSAINEVGFVSGMRALFWICRIFGRWPFRLVLYPVLAWYVATKPAARAASLDYLARVGKLAPAPSGALGVLRHFGAFAESILDKMRAWGGLLGADEVAFFGVEPLVRMIDAGQGAVLLCSHHGNMDLCRALSGRRPGLKLTVLVHTKHARAFNRMMGQIDPRSQLNLLQVTEVTPATAMMLAERIGRGEFVVIAGDRVPPGPNPRVSGASFLGSEAPFPVGPYILAGVLQCPAFMMFSMRRAGGHEIHFELLSEAVELPRKGRAAALGALAARYAARLEHHCARAPLEWFNFFDFWHQSDLDKTR
ncbi:LpxL/LpxP family acyltransferase [Massilia glaciei]|uniref:Acyltransferase n=1 Tax=Massilia glaciei TaxID=1524097 RepID=A0A2U2HE12_9BURK|nr:acyltransferase [Massilia glaciei]PWF41550.1 acyltransferase [Massilia glaciei]